MNLVNAEEPISVIPRTVEYNKDKAKLGKKLFHEPRLSSNDIVSCATCHSISNFGVDSLALSKGVDGKEGNRNSPTVYNSRFNESYFWDARAEDLNDQINGPIHNPVEMNSNWPDIIKKLKSDIKYVKEFRKVYKNNNITESMIKESIVEYEKSLITPNSPFDKYLNGDQKALSHKAIKGYELFKSYGCISCHQGKNIGGNMVQIFGVTEQLPKEGLGKDKGRFNVTKEEIDINIFRVPSLRNVSKTAPYFHDGSVTDLGDAIKVMAKYQLGEELKASDIEEIKAFLESLTGEPKEVSN